MNIKERINWLFEQVLFALQLSCRLGVLVVVTVLVLVTVYLGYKTGNSYEPTTEELLRNMLSHRNVPSEIDPFVQIFLLPGSLFIVIIFFIINLELRDWWKGVVTNLSKLGKFAKIFLTAGASLDKCMLSLWKFSKSALVATVLVGSGNSIVTREDPPLTVKRLLVPISNRVHFENAKFEGNRLAKGVTLGGARKASMMEMLKRLKHCGDANNPVKVRLYGFASNDEFRGYNQLESEIRNLETANVRAMSVHRILNEHLRESFKPPGEYPDWIQLEDPKQWPKPQALDASLEESLEMHEMKRRRSDLIKVMGNDTNIRDPFADRVVVLDLMDPGMCEVL